MLEAIVKALNARRDIQSWSLRHISTCDSQLYAVPTTVESRRSVVNERYVVSVLRQTDGPDGTLTCGSSSATLLPGDNIEATLDIAALMAGMVHNPPYSIPARQIFLMWRWQIPASKKTPEQRLMRSWRGSKPPPNSIRRCV